jgi:serralysin
MTLSTSKAISSSVVTSSIGVNTHLDYTGTYANLAGDIAAINYLGVKNLRDTSDNPNTVGPAGSWQQVANATGAKFDDYMILGSPAMDVATLGYAKTLAAQGILNFIEGGDENDVPSAVAQGNSIAWTASFQQQVYATGHALGLPVINMSFGAGWTAANNWQGNYDKVGDLSAYADYANAHVYPTVGQLPDPSILRLNVDAHLAAASRPVIETEIGWSTSTFSQTDIARFTLDAVFDSIKDGDVKSYFYALFDDVSGKFGLMNADGTARPAGAALHNLTTIMADSGAARTDSLTYGLTGTTVNDNSLLMEKSNGTFQLAVWNEIDAAHAVTLNLGTAAQTVRIYDPLTGISAVTSYSNASSVIVNVPDHPVIVEIVPMPPAATPNPVWTVPGPETATVGQALAIAGLSISDPWAASRAGSLALNLTAKSGTISGTDSAGKALAGSGTSAIHVSGSLAALNADLAGLSFTSATAGAAQLTVNVWDQAGVQSTKVIPITVTPAAIAAATAVVTSPAIAAVTMPPATTTAAAMPPASSTPQVIYGHDGDTIHVQGGTNLVYLLGSHGTIAADAGTNTLFTNGTGNTLTGGSGTDTIQAFSGSNTLQAGSGTETISFAGSNNTIYVGSGNDKINDGGSNNEIVFGKAGGGTAQIYGYVLNNGDTLDLRLTLASTSWTKDPATLGNFLKVGVAGADAVISIDPSGTAGGAASQLAVLHGSGPVSLSALLAHTMTV